MMLSARAIALQGFGFGALLVAVQGFATVDITVTNTIARPIIDMVNSGWLPSTGMNLFSMIDETIPDDSDYILATNSGAVCELNLNQTVYPGSSAQVLKFRAKSSTGNGIVVRLKQGTTIIRSATQMLTANDAEYSITLSPIEIASISSGILSVELETV